MRYRSKTIFYVIAASLISCAATILLMRGGVGNTVIMSAREYKEYSQLIALDELADKIEDEFYERAPSRDTLVAGAASGMVSTLEDPYACYYTAEEYQQHLSSMNGEYYGIGLLVGQPDAVGAAVLEVYEGGTSEAAGIKVGDIITHIDGEPTANMLLEELSAAIDAREKEGVLLTLLRNDQTIEISVAGGNIAVKHVEYRMLDGNIGYIAISMFTGNCADEFEEAMAELKGRGMNSLIIDLRNNPGGALDMVVEIADQLLGKGMRIVSVGDADSREEEIFEAKGNPIDIPVAVLVNENSASASEILTAAVQENGIGAVIGTKTFGKGIVQTTMPISSTGGWLKLTTDVYYTPNGNDIHGEGVFPDIYVQLPEGYLSTAIEEIPAEADTQLQKAIQYLDKAN